ncbi:hypothetical protein HDU83_008227, partial [Entophlyctis luteolus]
TIKQRLGDAEVTNEPSIQITLDEPAKGYANSTEPANTADDIGSIAEEQRNLRHNEPSSRKRLQTSPRPLTEKDTENPCNCTICYAAHSGVMTGVMGDKSQRSLEVIQRVRESAGVKQEPKSEKGASAKDADVNRLIYTKSVVENYGQYKIDSEWKPSDKYIASYTKLASITRSDHSETEFPTRLYSVSRKSTTGGTRGMDYICISYTWPDIKLVHKGWHITDITSDHYWEVKSISREGLSLIIDAIRSIEGPNERLDKGKLGIWSDSLCVDQSDNHDLQVETARSGTYYRQCQYCVVAFWNRIDPNAVTSQVDNFLRWCTRAWTAQEALLPRTLYLSALKLDNGSLIPAWFDVDHDSIEIFAEWIGGSQRVVDELTKCRKMRSVLKNDIGLADALAITLNREASFPPDKIYAAATMSSISGRVGGRDESISKAVDWMYRQLAPRERIKLALVSCRPNPNLEGGGWLPVTGHLFRNHTIDVATVEALVAKYIRGSHMELYTSRCCDIVVLPDRRWNSGLEETEIPLSNDYAKSTVIADAPDSLSMVDVRIVRGIHGVSARTKIPVSSGIFKGRYRFVAVGTRPKSDDPTMEDLTFQLKISEVNSDRGSDISTTLANRDVETKIPSDDWIRAFSNEAVVGLLLASVDDGSRASATTSGRLWSKVGIAVLDQRMLEGCGPHHEIMRIG